MRIYMTDNKLCNFGFIVFELNITLNLYALFIEGCFYFVRLYLANERMKSMKKFLWILMFAVLLIFAAPASVYADELKIKVTKEHFEQIDEGKISQSDLEQYAPEGILKKDW